LKTRFDAPDLICGGMPGMLPFPAFAAEIRTPPEQELTDITPSIQKMSRQALVTSTWPTLSYYRITLRRETTALLRFAPLHSFNLDRKF
jgi:hypothetical protein